jgi:DNA-directed RNA polymerase specialized sigma24 family protein
MTAAEPGDVAGRSGGVSKPARAGLGPVPADAGAEAAVAALYGAHYRSLVGLAMLLAGDAGMAEEAVQDAFVALHRGWRRLGAGDSSGENALPYLRQSVVNRCRLLQRHPAPLDTPGAEQGTPAVLAAMRALPPRQREALVLQHYAGLSASQAARMLGTSTRAVQRQTTRAMACLRTVLEREA